MMTAVAAFLLSAGRLLFIGSNAKASDDGGNEKAPATPEKHEHQKPVKASYEEHRKKDDDSGRAADRAFHERYDRNYDDQFECPH